MALRPFYAFVLSKTVLLFKQSTKPLMKRIDPLNINEKEAVLPEINRSNRNTYTFNPEKKPFCMHLVDNGLQGINMVAWLYY